MPSSFSTDLKLELMVTGENAGTWGTKTNTNLNLLQQAIAGYQDISIAGGAQTTTLTMDNASISNARNAVVKLTGTITGNQIVTVPNGIEKTYIVSNGTVGAFTVEFKTASGTGPTFSTTDKGIKILFADGTNIVDVNANFSSSSFPEIKVPQINDSNGNEEIKFTTTASAVNEFTIANAATGNGPEISATGSDTNIDLKITPKGTGKINLDGIKFPNADGSAGQALVTNGSGTLSFASAGLAWQSVKTSNFTAVKGEAYPINTTSSEITVTLPATPTAGDQVQVVDYAGTFDSNALTIAGNGEDIEGSGAAFQLTGDREGVILTYIDSTQGWIATSGINEGTDALTPAPFLVDFLVVAGGGGGGSNAGGGGGAGGFRSFTSSSLNVAQNYTVTVGGGGSTNSVGNNSVFGSTTSAGGGLGANYQNNGGNGGSGGGAAGGTTQKTGGTGNSPNTSPSQGNNGGNGSVDGSGASVNLFGGGGGGAGGVGGNATTSVRGASGAGTANSITGSSVTYAVGGQGGGGFGPNGTGAGANGTANRGNGGGGGESVALPGGSGGSGIVIIKYPDGLTISNPGGGLTSSTATAGGFKTTSFTAGTGTIQFN
jgi:hypothetical protein